MLLKINAKIFAVEFKFKLRVLLNYTKVFSFIDNSKSYTIECGRASPLILRHVFFTYANIY